MRFYNKRQKKLFWYHHGLQTDQHACSHQCPSSIQHGLVWQEVLLGSMITAVSQVIVLNQEAQVSHLPDLQFWGFWGISGMTEGKRQGHCIQYTGCCMGFIYKNKMHCNELTEGHMCSLVHWCSSLELFLHQTTSLLQWTETDSGPSWILAVDREANHVSKCWEKSAKQ